MAGIFSRFIFNNAIFNTSASDEDNGGGAGGPTLSDYKRYIRRLNKLAKASEHYNQSKYVKQVTDVAQSMPEIEVAAPILQLIAKAYEPDTTGIAESIGLEIEKMVRQLQMLIAAEQEREAEEELVILLCI